MEQPPTEQHPPQQPVDYQAFGLPPNDLSILPGEKRVVPLGGQHVPESMPTVYDQEYIKSLEKVVDYGDEYQKLIAIRKDLNQLKSLLKTVCPPLEAVLRHKALFTRKANPNNPKHVSSLKKKIEKELAKTRE